MAGHLAVLALICDALKTHAVTAVLLLFVTSVIYDLYLHPLARFPGPLWARVTRFYWVSVLISGQQHLRTHALHQKYGPVVRIAPNTLSFSSHLAIKTIYGRGASSLAKPDGSGSGFLPAGDPSIFFANEPAMHACLRRHIAHAYSMTSVAQMEPSVAVLVQEFIRKVDSFAGTGEVFDLVEWVNHLTFDLIGELGYGNRFGFMERGMHYISPFFLTLSAFPALRRILEPVVVVRLPPPKSPRGVPHLLSIANAIIAERGASLTPLTEKDLLGGFLASKRSTGDPLFPSTVLGDVMATLVAGADTTAAFIQGLSYYLLQHPPALQRLQRELDTHCPVTYADTLPLEYFQAVVKETLRLSPSIGSMFPRLVPSGGAELLPGVWVPGGTVVGVNNWVVGRDKSLYGEDAMEFRPERWLEDQGKAKPRFTEFEFAFGGGDWVCIGRNVAMMEICKVVPRLFAGFEMEMVEPEKPWVETAGQFLFKSELKFTLDGYQTPGWLLLSPIALYLSTIGKYQWRTRLIDRIWYSICFFHLLS